MKKMIMALVCALSFTNIISAQQFSNVIIANGGTYEFAAPFNDRATIGAYDAVQDKYWVFDTIQEESVQGLVIDTNYAYLASGSKIIKYDLTTYERVAETSYAGSRSLTLHDTLLFVGKFYGSGAFLSVYDSRDLSFLFEIAEIDQTVNDVVVVGDTAYVPYNQKGTIDQWPPYMIFNDTIGKIGVVDLVNQSFVRDVVLDTIGSGSKNAFVYGDTVVVTCEMNGSIAKYNVNDMSVDFDTIGVSGAIAMIDSVLYASYNGSLGTYDVKNGTMLTTGLVTGTFVASAYDTLNDQIVLTATDYGSYGRAYIFQNNGTFVDSVEVNVSPEGLAVNYKEGTAAPVALNDYAEAMEDSAGITVDVLSSDFDPNGDVLTISILTNAINGTVTLVGDSINYVPNASFFGLDSVEYKICDGSACDSAYLVINVVHISAVNDVLPLAQLEMYPNPAIDMFTVSTAMLGAKQVVMYDLKGQIVRLESFSGSKTAIGVQELPKGAYIVKVSNGKSVELGKLLVD